LLARIRAVLRRTVSNRSSHLARKQPRAYRFEGWELNLRLLSLKTPEGINVRLTRSELGLLRAFLSAPQRVLSRDQLLDLTHVIGADLYERSVDVTVARVRRKIESDTSRPRFIRCKRGVGYYFDAAVSVVC
jgi:DNA-binding response OmpR family regulator